MPRVTIEIEDIRTFEMEEGQPADDVYYSMLVQNGLYLGLDADPKCVAGVRVSLDTVAVPFKLMRELTVAVLSGDRALAYSAAAAVATFVNAQEPVA